MRIDGPFELAQSAIHVWPLRIAASDGARERHGGVLSADELDRAARLRPGKPRRLFVETRFALRRLLGRYLDLHPAKIEFVYGAHGKPALGSTAGIQFNVAHSEGMSIIAVSTGCPVGVDLEYRRPMTDLLQVASRFFCPEEAEELTSLPASQRNDAFFRCWTRKEAFAKATGDGLAVSLDHFRVTVQPDSPARLVPVRHDELAAEAWTLRDLVLAPNYAAALAYHDRPRALTLFPILNSEELSGGR